MELRLAVEIEAAALAAEPRPPRTRLRGIDARWPTSTARSAAAMRRSPRISRFHRAIAEATANPHYARVPALLGRHVIPRQSVRATVTIGDEQTAYLKKIQTEHRQIASAIRARDSAAARRAMRTRLGDGLVRYRRLAKLAAAG